MFEYVYLRDNPRGFHEEFWYRSARRRAWLVVRRNTQTHAIELMLPGREKQGWRHEHATPLPENQWG